MFAPLSLFTELSSSSEWNNIEVCFSFMKDFNFKHTCCWVLADGSYLILKEKSIDCDIHHTIFPVVKAFKEHVGSMN